MNRTTTLILGLFSIVALIVYVIIFPINNIIGKMFALAGVMIYFVFTLSYSIDENYEFKKTDSIIEIKYTLRQIRDILQRIEKRK